MLPFTLRQLEYVIAVADAAHFGRAAARCGVSQPSLSAQVALVEDLLGQPVFERTRHGARVARRAEAFVAGARRLLREAEALARVGRGQGAFEGEVRLGVIPTVAPWTLPLVSAPVRDRWPSLAPIWTEDQTARLVERVEGGALDAAFLALEVDLGGLEALPVAREPFVVAVGVRHPLAALTAVPDVASLGDDALLVLAEGHCLGDHVLAACGRAGARDAWRATSLVTLLELVAAGHGVTLLPALAAGAAARHPGLRLLPFAAEPPTRALGFALRGGSPFSETVAGLAALFGATLAPHLAGSATAGSKPAAAPGRARRGRPSG